MTYFFADLLLLNPFNPHDASKHHFASLKHDLITKKFHGTVLVITIKNFHLTPALRHLRPLQVENCDSNSRLVADEDDNSKFGLERINIIIEAFL